MRKKTLRKQMLSSIIKCGIFSFVVTIVISLSAFYPWLRQRAVSQAENVNTAIVQHLESTLTFVENFTENIAVVVEQNEDVQDYLNEPVILHQTAASVALNNICSYSSYIRGIALLAEDVPTIDSMTNFSEDDYALLESEYIQKMQINAFTRSYSSVYETLVGRNNYYTVVYARNFYLNNRWVTIAMFINLNTVLSDIQTVAGDTLDAYYLLDAGDEEFFANGTDRDIEIAVEIAEEMESNQRQTSDGNIVFLEKSITCGFGVVALIKRSSLMNMLLPYVVELFFAILLFLILMLIITSRSMNELIKPVYVLSNRMLRAADGDLDCKIQTSREDEFGQLERSFNKMIDDLKRSIAVISEKEAREQRIRFSLLVSQIDPHFIYNTLSSINYLARKERCADIIKVNSALCAILRDRLRVNDIQITDTVSSEVRVVSQYIEIERYMYGGNLDIEWEIEPDLMEAQIPKNMIQPLVENALFHGLIGEEDGQLDGTIWIRIRRDESGRIILSVEDDGFGMDPEKLEQVRSERFSPEERGARIGLANIRGRLFYLYHEEDCLSIESEAGKGTCITITFLR